MSERAARLLVPSLLFIALVVAAVGSLGAPLITRVATGFHVSLASAQWTLTITLLAGAVATPVLGRLGSGPYRRETLIATLVVVAVGCLLTVLPLPFWVLLAGRALQGIGLGLTALMIGAARDQLEPARAASTIALISIASTVGIGLGYPLAGLLADLGGLRASYALGLVISVVALAAAIVSVPAPPPGRLAQVDVAGAVLLGGALLAFLVVINETGLWRAHVAFAWALTLAALALLVGWVLHERRAAAPLIDVRALRNRALAAASITMVVAGVGMYLLLTLITRYLQTPKSAGYGFGLDTFESGLALVPFSAFGFAAGKLVAGLSRRWRPALLLAAGPAVVLIAFVVFGAARGQLAEPLVAMAILGYGVGGVSAAMPAVVLAVTSAEETSSAMAFNQVLRSVGFSFGSALGAVILARYTPAGHTFPRDRGYTIAAVIGAAAMVAAVAVPLTVRSRSRR